MILKVYNDHNSQSVIAQICDILENGGVIIYPTDALYAIGCHALKERPIEKIAKLKGFDPKRHLFSVTCDSLQMASHYAKVNNFAFKVMKRYAPGPFTFVLPSSNKLPRIFRNRKEVGIRIPVSPIQEIVRQLDAPILSATIPYMPEWDIEYLTNPELIDEKWGDEVDLILDGGIGKTEGSTIVSFLNDELEIRRQGLGQID